MKKTDYSNVALGQEISGTTLTHEQNALIEGLKAITRSLGVDANKVTVLFGCEMAVNGTQYSQSAGAVIYKDEVYFVDTFSGSHETNIPVYQFYDENVGPAVRFSDLQYRDVHIDHKMRLVLAASGSGEENYNAVEFLKDKIYSLIGVQSAIQTAIASLVDGSPATLDTLNELAAALNDDENAFNTLQGMIDARYTKTELDAFFEETSSEKKEVNWERITDKPSIALSDHTHDGLYYTKNEVNNQLSDKADSSHEHEPSEVGLGNLPNAKSDSISEPDSEVLATSKAVMDAKEYARNWNNITNKPSIALSGHTHDGSYYTKTEVNNQLSGKANSSHNHDERYYTESEVNNQLSGKANSSHTHDGLYYTESEVENQLSTAVSEAKEYARNWNNITNKPPGITATRKVQDQNGSIETVIIKEGIITKWDNVSIQQGTTDDLDLNCIALDTPILMADGSTQILEKLKVGEEVQSVHIPGLTEQNYTSWKGSLEGMKKSIAKVISKTLYNGDSCLLINGSLKMTATSEYVLCRKNVAVEWQFVTASQLQQGDYLMDSGLKEIMVDSIEQVNEPIDLGHINVEPDDLFFGQGLIIHNIDVKE